MEPLIDKKALSRFLGISVRTLTTLMSRGRIPYIRIGPRLIRFSLAEVKEVLWRSRAHNSKHLLR